MNHIVETSLSSSENAIIMLRNYKIEILIVQKY